MIEDNLPPPGKAESLRLAREASTQRRRRAEKKWRDKIDKVGEAAIVGWADDFGVDSTARIIAGIADENPRNRPFQEWKILLLLRVVHERLQAPDRAIGEIAREVAEVAVQPRVRKIPVEKLASELETRFREKLRIWRLFARPRLTASVHETASRLGLERVAGIVVALTQTNVGGGRLEEMEPQMLAAIAHITRRQPERTLNDIASEVAKNAPQIRNRSIEADSFLSHLRCDFRRTRHTWTLLSGRTAPPTDEAIARASRRRRSIGERRAIARIVKLMPTALDVYDTIISEIRMSGEGRAYRPQIEIAQIRLARRARVEQWFVAAMDRQQTANFVKGSNGNKKIPRGFCDLIEWDLHQFLLSRRKTPGKPRVEPKPSI